MAKVMIQANELRIGNYVKYGDRVVKVEKPPSCTFPDCDCWRTIAGCNCLKSITSYNPYKDLLFKNGTLLPDSTDSNK